MNDKLNIDYITVVKEQNDQDGNLIGYLVNDSMSVSNSSENRHMRDVSEWLKTNTALPQYTVEEIAKAEQDTINSEARQYLASTDWYITRQFESGVEVPKDILEKRKESRLKVVD